MKKVRLFIFAAKKFIGAAITIFLVMSILFLLLHSVPGGDIVTRMHPFASAEQKAQIRELWGLDKPLFEQYVVYMKKVFTLDYRAFYDQRYDVMDALLFLLPYTLLLFGTATILSYLIGTFIGMRLLYEERFSKKFISGISIVLYAVPAFVLAVYSRTWFTFKYQIFPPVDIQFEEVPSFLGHLENMWMLLPAMVLPLIILVLVGLARPLLLMRDQMSIVAGEPFVLTARAKGLKENTILSRHVARCALLPLLNDAAINVALIVSGGILIEFIFTWPGIGRVLFLALKVLDYTTISAAIFLLAVILMISMVVVDILNAYLDPRVSV